MARTQESNIRNILSSLFSERWIEAKSREVGFIRRSRKIDPVAFFWTLVFGFGLGNARTFAALRRCYQAEIGESIVPSSFYDRFTSSLGKLMKAALCHLFETALVELRRRFPNLKERMPFERWSAIFAEFAVSILHSLLENRRRKQRR
ncbi:MAG: hypothetical protein QNJ97_08735, partial [Myxococcota bacterium]|nr:hypothetical protein [Myxococcota bacterium]